MDNELTQRTMAETGRRYGVFTLGVFFMSLGVSLVTCSLTGTSPISSLPYVMSLNTPLSMGVCIFLLNIVLMVGQMMMLGREGTRRCRTELWLQIPVSVAFGLFVDATMLLLSGWHPAGYLHQLAAVVTGCLCMAVGVSLEVVADVAMVSGEYFVHIASRRLKMKFGTVKLMFDVTLVVLAAVASWLMAGRIDGLREGTVIVAVMTGPLVRIIMPRLGIVGRWQSVA